MSDASYDIDRVRSVFGDWALTGRAEGMEKSHGPFAWQAFERLDLEREAWYLDIGCGNGYTVRWAARSAPGGRAVGLDVAPEMIDLARELSLELPTTEYHVATFPDHDLPLGRFDAIFSMEVLYYLPSLGDALAEIYRLLAPGGRFACCVDYYLENTASHGWPADVGVDMRLLSAAQWREAFEAAGLEVVEQANLVVPADQASEPWKAELGSLMTLGRKGEGSEGG
jgi:SAM-dependent methyltransferase